MAIWIDPSKTNRTTPLLREILVIAKKGQRSQFLTDSGMGAVVVQRLRVALSRSRNRNLARGVKLAEFTLHHAVYPYSVGGKRHDCVVMWTVKNRHHIERELLDDILER